ncbi:hypothetical protein DENIS_0760 [Desulfonema ishimotonii]|uniref:Uncharacterized protein n=1 Tax=Desulfonema ishimotonii TaxID=45657 RepID=A0A401FS77_9BACT|nr:hypothetical protein [Desulfonema ishimotonii]GBC59819.1 hypothetical protein DENIS_0760 [Desulfonema ishimotonii]
MKKIRLNGLVIWAAMMAFFMLIPSAGAEQIAISVNAAADYSSGAHSVIDVNPMGGPRSVQNDLLPTISDLGVAGFDRYFYRMERYMGDNITKFDVENPVTPIWQYSTLDDGETASSNPHALIFASPEKAYLLRYGTAKAWIVNPSATTAAEFKIGELDLSAYADEDGIPEMTSGVIVNGRLFILLARLNRNDSWAPKQAYIAVFDIATDTEIDTGTGNDIGVGGIALPMTNPGTIQYISENGMIYIGCQGGYESSWSGTPAEYTGGILGLNPMSYALTTVLDDGDDANHPYGNISGMAVVSPEKGYFIGYAGYGDNTLYTFNPTTGAVTGTVAADLENKNIVALSVDQNGYLWAGNGTDANLTIINPTNDTVDEKVGTNLNPLALAFAFDETFTYYLPYYVAGGDFWTGVALRNMDSAENATVTVVGYGQDGKTVMSETRSLNARGQSSFVAGNGLNQTGWLKVMSSQPLTGLAFVGNSGASNYMADITMEKATSPALIIPHIAQDEMWDTTVMVCNPNSSVTSVTLTVVGTDGAVASTRTYDLAANGSGVYPVSDLTDGAIQPGGSVEISATQGVAAFALYDNLKSGGYYYSGIRAVNADE